MAAETSATWLHSLETIFLHGAVSEGVGAAGRGGAHATDRRVRAGVDRKPEACKKISPKMNQFELFRYKRFFNSGKSSCRQV